jgi:3'-phosphoadenosine 5'-phosphosulfate sulfotransferase (PAPS reductase)/FAD synthetase
MLPHVEQTRQILTERLAQAQRPVVWASGGKDSTVLLHLCRPWASQLVVLHATKRGDDGWPGITEGVEEHCARWGYTLRTVQPWKTFPAYVHEFGWPVETVPTTLEGSTALAPSPYQTGTIRVASWLHCTFVRTIYPLYEAMIGLRADLLLTGSRLSDAPANAAFAQEVHVPGVEGWARSNPLAHWSTVDIWAYIDAERLPLPPLYAWKREADYEAVDCLSCTWQPRHWETLQRHHPDEYAVRWPQVRPVYEAVQAALHTDAAAIATLLQGDHHACPD